MTDSSDPRAPKSSRRKSSRQPATIDVKPTVIDEGIVPGAAAAAPDQDPPTQGDTPGPGHGPAQDGTPIAGESPVSGDSPGRDDTLAAQVDAAVQEALSEPRASVDAGAGVDALGSAETDRVGTEGLREEIADREIGEAAWSPRGAGEGEPGTEQAPPPAPARSRDRFGPLVGAGLIGGLLGAGIALGVQALVPVAQDDRRITDLEQRIATLPTTQGIDRLVERVRAVEESRRSQAERIARVAETARRADENAQQALNRPQPEAPPAPAAPDTAALTELSGRLSGLEGQVRDVQQAAAGRQALEQRLNDQARRAEEQSQQLAQQTRRIEEQGQRTAELDQRFAALTRQVTEGASNASRAATAVVLTGRLSDALRDGTPYADVLDAMRRAQGDAARLAPLEPFARQGAPSAAKLAEEFDPLGDAIIRESRSGAEGWSDRVLRMMDRVVTVRPVNEPGATGVPSLVARIREALERGDVRAAVAAWESLPEPARRLSEDWGRRAKQRADAEAAAQALASDALANLNRTPL